MPEKGGNKCFTGTEILTGTGSDGTGTKKTLEFSGTGTSCETLAKHPLVENIIFDQIWTAHSFCLHLSTKN